ncbi:DnaJ-domain-containing protein [Schizopora paradoxa]|uniref:DnaJ-domain-containing protein n=1 Tax=Schizopora paradoxa TaxID=27342 RepID=A0A0H2RV86_9AGAM|nr:DnaJ-domain-containing protein [Schizopora paradoxa]
MSSVHRARPTEKKYCPRQFSSSASQGQAHHPPKGGGKTHYDTLNVPRNASRMDVKASYFRLSKLFHPDVNSDPGAKEAFHSVSEAYGVLSDDRKRRKYDQSLLLQSHSSNRSTSPFNSTAAETFRTARSHQAGYDGRKRGATHAWAGAHHHHANYGAHQSSRTDDPETHHRNTDPFSSPYVKRATGSFAGGFSSSSASSNPSRARKVDVDAEMERQRYDRLSSESNLFRALRVVALLVVMSGIGSLFGGAKA